jgi:hypothetical protein
MSDLEGRFFLANNVEGSASLVKLSSHRLVISASTSKSVERIIPIEDIYGCLCMRSPSSTTRPSYHLIVYIYSLSRVSGKSTMQRSQCKLTYESSVDDDQRNLHEVLRWRDTVRQLIVIQRQLPRKFRSNDRSLTVHRSFSGSLSAEARTRLCQSGRRLRKSISTSHGACRWRVE